MLRACICSICWRENARQRKGMIVYGLVFSPFMKTGVTLASLRASVVLRLLSEAQKILVTTGWMTYANYLRTMGLILSGQAALCGFSWFSLFLTPPSMMFSGGILSVVFSDPSELRNPGALVLKVFSDSENQGEKNWLKLSFKNVHFMTGSSSSLLLLFSGATPCASCIWCFTNFQKCLSDVGGSSSLSVMRPPMYLQ